MILLLSNHTELSTKGFLKNAQCDYYNEFLEPKLDENGKYLFNFIKTMNKDCIGIETLISDNKTITDSKEKAEILSKMFESVFQNETNDDIPNILPSQFPDMDDFEITENGVLNQLLNLNIHKSTGPDELSPQLLNILAPVISPFLTKIYKQSLSQSKCPYDWKIQYISPLLKPGNIRLTHHLTNQSH